MASELPEELLSLARPGQPDHRATDIIACPLGTGGQTKGQGRGPWPDADAAAGGLARGVVHRLVRRAMDAGVMHRAVVMHHAVM